MPTREEIARLMCDWSINPHTPSTIMCPDGRRISISWTSTDRTDNDLAEAVAARIVKLVNADAILALPSPAPVGEAALLADLREWADSMDAISDDEIASDQDGGSHGFYNGYKAALEDLELQFVLREQAAQQTAAAEAREEGR